MVNSYNDWLRYAMGASAVALGISVCFAPRESLFIKLGSKYAPPGTRPFPQWLAVFTGFSFAVGGADLVAYKFIAYRMSAATPLRQGCVVVISVCLAFGLQQLLAGLSVRPGSLTVDPQGYRGTAFFGALVCLSLALTAAYFGFVAP